MPEWTEPIRRRLEPLKLDAAREAEILDELSQHLDDRFLELRSLGTAVAEAERLALEELDDDEALSLALRFVPYSDDHGHFNFGWTIVLVGFGLLALGASLYLVYVLEILKFTRFRRREIMRETGEGVTDEEIERQVRGEIETGEWEAVN